MTLLNLRHLFTICIVLSGLVGAAAFADVSQDLDSDHSVTTGSNNGGKPWESPAGDARLKLLLRGRRFFGFGATPIALEVGFGERTLYVHCATNEVGHHRVFVQIREGYDSFYDGPHNMTSAQCNLQLQDKANELTNSARPLGFFDLVKPSRIVNQN